MARKDWKRITGFGIPLWDNKLTSESLSIIPPGPFRSDKFETQVQMPGRNPVVIKKSKTKSSALKFARKYMETH